MTQEWTHSGNMKRWLRAIGFFRGFLLVSFVPVSMGAMVAWWETGAFSPLLLALTLLAIWSVHVGANLINDYYDHVSGTDDINQVITPFSGGTRVIQEGLLAPKPIRNVGYAAFGIGGLLLLLLLVLTGWPVLVFSVLGISTAIAYSAKPFWLAYRGLGELTIGLNFGPFLVLTAFYIQTRTLSIQALAAGLVLGLFSSAIITINEIPDIMADTEAGKRNLVVRYGRKFGIMLWSVLLWGALVLIFAAGIGGLFPKTTLLGLVMIIPIFFITRKAAEKTGELSEVVARCRFTILSQMGVWLFLSIGFFWAKAAGR